MTSKEMENQSFNERHSLTGNSGICLGLTSLRPKMQPIRVKALLEMYGSDEEESEEKGKESDGESDCDDIQPLPDDDDDNDNDNEPDAQKLPMEESSGRKVDSQVETDLERQTESPVKQEKIHIPESAYKEESSRCSLTFTSEEQSCVNFKMHTSTSLPSESVASGVATVGSSDRKHSNEINHDSNTDNFKPPEVLFSSTSGKSSYTLTSKSECISQLSLAQSKFHSSHSINPALHPEPGMTIAPVQGQTLSHRITDTPHKHNPPVGSMRPTPSVSHRSMFQTPCSEKFNPQDYSKNDIKTPRSEKLHPEDYSKNHGQTPATIFGNWSQRHMARTPMQNRSSALPGDAGTAGTSHEIGWYRGTEEKKVRRPLGETMQSSTNHRRLSQSEKSDAAHYAADSSTAKHHENPENLQAHGAILESVKEKSTKKNASQQYQQQQQQQHHHHHHHHVGLHESKENRHPPPLIDKLPAKEEGKKGNLNSMKESIVLSSSNGKSGVENRQEAVTRHRAESGDTPASWSARSNCTPAPKCTTLEAVEEKNSSSSSSNEKANVQLSIPSSIRKVNRGETMVVKGKEYLILGTLGQGMSCYVLRVQDLTSLELRAIKVVNLSRMDKDSAQGCMQEISMLHKLQAPCVVRMFDYEIKYPMVHVVMEMGDTDFRSLLNSMSEKRRLPLTMILYYWTEMLTAVKHIHDNGVIHSDLKPANFLLVRGRLKLIDFGIASSINADMTSVVKNSTIGTLNYISPEALMDIGSGGSGSDSPNQNVKYKITFKSDVWSLGCILYSLIYGYTPFNSIRSQWAKIQAITNPNPKISYALPPGNDVDPPPPILIEVLRKCLQHDPKARPTVAQLLQIPYITTKPNSRALIPDLPSNIVMKIRHSLTDDEWRQFTEIMEARRNHS